MTFNTKEAEMADEVLSKKKPSKKKVAPGKSTKKDKIDFNPTTDGTVYEAVLTIPQRMRRAMAIHRIEPKLQRAREVARRRLAGNKSLKKRSAAAARAIVRRKVAGDRGVRYQELSSSEKIQIDAMTEKRIKAIRNLAKKLLPRIKQAEQKRLASVLNAPKAVSEAVDVKKLQKALGDQHRIVGHGDSHIQVQSHQHETDYNAPQRMGAKIIDRLRAAGVKAARSGSHTAGGKLHTHIQIQENSIDFDSPAEAEASAKKSLSKDRNPDASVHIYRTKTGKFRTNHAFNSAGREYLNSIGAHRVGEVKK